MDNPWAKAFFIYDAGAVWIVLSMSAVVLLAMYLRLAYLLLRHRTGFSVMPIPLILLFFTLCVAIRTKMPVFVNCGNRITGKLLDVFILVCTFSAISYFGPMLIDQMVRGASRKRHR
jgi:hypothetical protein